DDVRRLHPRRRNSEPATGTCCGGAEGECGETCGLGRESGSAFPPRHRVLDPRRRPSVITLITSVSFISEVTVISKQTLRVAPGDVSQQQSGGPMHTTTKAVHNLGGGRIRGVAFPTFHTWRGLLGCLVAFLAMNFLPSSAAAEKEAARCINLFDVDLNALYNVTQPFVNRNCHEVPVGEFFIANDHIIVNTEYSDDLRRQLEATNYHFAGATPLQDLQAKIVSIRLEVTNKATGRVQNYSFTASEVATTQDHIHNDALVCADFFVAACAGRVVPAPPSSPMLAFIPKVHPLPPGSYLISIYYT